MRRTTVIGILFTLICIALPAAGKRPITFEDMMKMQQISDPQVSPDGRWVAYTQTSVDLEANKKTGHIWLIPTAGGEPRQLTFGDGSDSRARWAPDGQSLAFISSRGGKSQVWILPMNGGEARQLTHISTEADGVTWAAKSNTLLFTSSVYPDCASDACNQQRLEEAEKSQVKARVIDRLFFRHWDHWTEGRYNHLFAVSAEGGEPRDLTPGAYDAPTFFLGAPDGYSISPDGKEVCYTSNRATPPSAVAWTTNNDLYLVDANGGGAKNITADNHGSDASPQYSPNGRYIAYTSQARDGYESDLFRLRVYDRETGKIKDLTTGFDQWVTAFAWAPDNDTIYLTATEKVGQPIFKTSVSNLKVEKVADGDFSDLSVTPDGKAIIATRNSLTEPANLYRIDYPLGITYEGPASKAQSEISKAGRLTQLTHVNDALLAELDMSPGESVWTKGAGGAQIQSLIVKPPAFDAGKRYPAIVLVHGGPQSGWEDGWSYRWNAELFASHGYVVMMTNFHGSTGYGQKFVESISGDWGGAPYQDIMLATDYLESLPYVDKTRVGAAGASFGGYMIDWIATQTDRFKALVSHDGVYDNRSEYGETEELWFDEWEFKGPVWDPQSAALRAKWSPSHYVQNIKTPMLIVEGEQDFRVPMGQAIQLFTTLQRRGVPSKMLFFPNECHWVLKPQDGRLWYKTVLGWLDQYLRPE
jgi:dipeptidyl aminopeptidase/acylaminoacyl peptidase